MINWILQKNLTNPNVLARIKSALNGVDEIWEEVSIIPFSNQLPPIQYLDTFKIIYGSTTFLLSAYRDATLKEGVFFDPARFQMQYYVKIWKQEVLNADGQLLTVGTVDQLKSTPNQHWFIRPNEDSKAFSGKIVTFEELVNWSEKIGPLEIPTLNKETEVWIALPQNIQKEWRLFIVDNEIISASRYMNQGILNESNQDIPDKMLEYADSLIATHRLSDVYVMDIAQVHDGFKLIECNCFNGTGFYQHDIEKVVRAINHFVKQKSFFDKSRGQGKRRSKSDQRKR